MNRRIIYCLLMTILFLGINVGWLWPKENRGGQSPDVYFKNNEGRKVLFYRKSYALLIGIWNYDYWPKFKKQDIENDLEEVKESLENHGFMIEKVLNPTYRHLKATIENFGSKYEVDIDSRIFILFSGHGYSGKSRTKGYLVPKDAPRPQVDLTGFMSRSIKMEDIKGMVQRIEAKHVLFAFDSCFSGAIFKRGYTTIPEAISEEMINPARQFITAGNVNQKVPVKSVFISALVKGINGEADLAKDGYISGVELYLYIKDKFKKHPVKQAPQYGSLKISDKEGSIIFVALKKQTPSPPKPVDIDLSDIEEWSRWLKKFRENIDKINKVFDQNPEISRGIKKQKWQELLRAYSADNPYSEDDERLRDYVKEKIAAQEIFNESPFKTINHKAKRIYKNNQGFWEADFGGGIVMVYIPPGEFTMGSNRYNDTKPRHKVYLDGYWMGKTELTVKQYRQFVNETNHYYYEEPGKESKNNDDYPICFVSWYDANDYCDWLSKKIGLKFKLPTEAQWEKAARGTDARKYPWGNSSTDPKGNCTANVLVPYFTEDGDCLYRSLGMKQTGEYPQGASPYGLLDMAGNVSEWCSDWYEIDYYKNSPQKNPKGPDSFPNRVLRGGSCGNRIKEARCAVRFFGKPSSGSGTIGFRLCMEL